MRFVSAVGRLELEVNDIFTLCKNCEFASELRKKKISRESKLIKIECYLITFFNHQHRHMSKKRDLELI
mgnify:CR=1 FL=1